MSACSQTAVVADLVRLTFPGATAIQPKAMSFLRLLQLKGVVLGAANAARMHIAVLLAANVLGEEGDREGLKRASGVGEKAFREAYTSVLHVLGVEVDSSPRRLCAICGIKGVAGRAETLLAAFGERSKRQLPDEVKAQFDVSRQPALAIAAVKLAAQKKKALVGMAVQPKIDMLCERANVTIEQVDVAEKQMFKICFPKAYAAEHGLGATEEEQEKFDAWKKRMREPEASSQDAPASNPPKQQKAGPKKQTTLTFSRQS